MNTARHEDRDDSLKVDAERLRRLRDKADRGAYEAEWKMLLDECLKLVRDECQRFGLSSDETIEIEHLVVKRLPRIVKEFDPSHASGAGFRTFLSKPIKHSIEDYFRSRKAERTEVGVFSADEGAGNEDGSGASEVPRPSRDLLRATWDESTPASYLERSEALTTTKANVAAVVARLRLSQQDKGFFTSVVLEDRLIEVVAREAKVEECVVSEAVQRVRRAVANQTTPKKLTQPASPLPLPPRDSSATRASDIRRVESVTVSIASPKQIRAQSSGEVHKPKTLEPRSLKPVKDGLMCERIFGPMIDWKCECDKSHGPSPPGSKCPRCGMELLPATARRQRMGHIELAAPVLNGWLFQANASLVCRVLDMKRSEVDALIYRQGILVLDPGSTNLRRHQVLDHAGFKSAQASFGADSFKSKRGAEGLREGLAQVDLGKCLVDVEAELAKTNCRSTREQCLALSKKLKGLIDSGQRLEWIVMEVLPVLPAGLRPEIPIPSSKEELGGFSAFIVHDLKDSAALASKVHKRADAVSAYIYGRLKASTAAQLEARHADAFPTRKLEASLVKEFSSILMGDSIWDVERFNGVKLRKDTRKLLASEPTVNKIVRLNRQLLEDAYKKELSVRYLHGDLARKANGDRFATSDLNQLYRRVLVENRRVKELLAAKAPEAIVHHRIAGLQKAVDALLHIGRPAANQERRALKPLAQCLEGKSGRFRQNLLGKRVDYSGRAVIVVGPELKVNQCGLPKKMALALFEPFIIRRLKEQGCAKTVRGAKKIIRCQTSELWDLLEAVTKQHPVLLNRAPTLHRLSVQAFEPVLIEGDAIRLHPLVCPGYNADFDGDQMAVHVPLSVEAQMEARLLMMAPLNFFSPGSGRPILTPTQDIVLGCHYLTVEPRTPKDPNQRLMLLGSTDEVFAQEDEHLRTHDRVLLKNPDRGYKRVYGVTDPKVIETTVGRVLFNEIWPKELGFFNGSVDKTKLAEMVSNCHHDCGEEATIATLEKLKKLGFDAATKAGISIGIGDLLVPPDKPAIIASALSRTARAVQLCVDGVITQAERVPFVRDQWKPCRKEILRRVREVLQDNQGSRDYNPIWLMLDSGARGGEDQVVQLSGMRGLMNSDQAVFAGTPIASNFREGLSVPEFFTSASGARGSIADRSLATADAGYLTRRLVHAAHDVMISELDCGADHGRWVETVALGNEKMLSLSERIVGRFSIEEIFDPNNPGPPLLAANSEITEAVAKRIEKSGIEDVQIRSVLGCKSKRGVCVHCYGRNPGTGRLAELGDAVGVIAAQSIGEPGTQLTMRTFHLGGVATGTNSKQNDITGGLPRVVELFEARRTKHAAEFACMDGVVKIGSIEKSKRSVVITNEETGQSEEHRVPVTTRVFVSAGARVNNGDQLTEGPIDLRKVLASCGIDGLGEFLINEVQGVYRPQGAISDKHIEVIVRQMLRHVRITDPGDTRFLWGDLIDKTALEEENQRIEGKGGKSADGLAVLLGISRVSLESDSFLTAAAFRETPGVLTEAAVQGKVDNLDSLNANVMVGGLIPVGTGFQQYRNVRLKPTGGTQDEAESGGEKPNDIKKTHGTAAP